MFVSMQTGILHMPVYSDIVYVYVGFGKRKSAKNAL